MIELLSSSFFFYLCKKILLLTIIKNCKTDCICIQFQIIFQLNDMRKNWVANHTQIYHNYAYDERRDEGVGGTFDL